jgi:cytochrome c
MRSAVWAFLAIAFHVCGASAAPIHDVAKTGDVAALTALLDAGADVNESNGIATPLYYSVKAGHIEAAKLLVARGADVNLAAKWGPPLMAAADLGKVEFVNLLLYAGADATVVFKQQTALHVAADKGCLDCVAALMEKGADVNALNHLRQPPLHLAVVKGHRAVADYLLSHGYKIPAPPPIAPLLATADLAKGEALFTQACRKCHFAEGGKEGLPGPNLWNVVGRARGTVKGYKNSAAMREAGGNWSFENLSVYLSDPARAVPGTEMDFVGIQDDGKRADLIAFLRTRSDNPEPLPR